RHIPAFPGATLPATSIRAIIPKPGGAADQFLLATTEGLYDATLAADPAADVVIRVPGFGPNATAPAADHITDVVATTGAPNRLWAAVRGDTGVNAQLWTFDISTPGAGWVQVPLPGVLTNSSLTFAT